MARKGLKGEMKTINFFSQLISFLVRVPNLSSTLLQRCFFEVKKQSPWVFLELGGDIPEFSLRTLISSCLCESQRCYESLGTALRKNEELNGGKVTVGKGKGGLKP